MSDSWRFNPLASFFCLVVLFLGCNRAPDQAKIGPGDGTRQKPSSGPQKVADKTQPKDAPGSSPTVEPRRKDIDPSFHISLEPLLGSEGNVHIYFIQQRPASNEEPFFVVWTDARGYAGSTGYPSVQNVPPRKNLVDGNYRSRYGGKDNEYDQEVKWSFEITVAERGHFKIAGKTYDFAKGTLFLISGRDDNVRVKQLRRDPSKLPGDRNAVVAVAKADPDIKEFLTKTAKPK